MTPLYLIFKKLAYPNTTKSSASVSEFETLLRRCLDRFHDVHLLGDGVRDPSGPREFRVTQMLLYDGSVIAELRIPEFSDLEALRSYLRKVKREGIYSLVWVWDVEGELYEPELLNSTISQNITIEGIGADLLRSVLQYARRGLSRPT